MFTVLFQYWNECLMMEGWFVQVVMDVYCVMCIVLGTNLISVEKITLLQKKILTLKESL